MSAKPPMTALTAGKDPEVDWFPDFCNFLALFALILVSELVVLVILLAPSNTTQSIWKQLPTSSAFVQWLAILSALCLCKLKTTLTRLTPTVGLAVAYLVIIAITAIGSALVYLIDHALQWGFTPQNHSLESFTLSNVAICALIAAALLRYFYVLQQWRNRVRATAKAQFDALQARIRPHFLFNSMNTIASLIRTRPQDAERAVEDLSDLFRAALSGRDLSTLGHELELIQHYLDIEHLRLGERLQVQWNISALPRDFSLPALLLQPLVENAIHHGIQLLPEGGVLSIEGHTSKDVVEITIRNPRPIAHVSTEGHNGIGIANTRGRIEYHFGSRGSLEVETGADYFACKLRLPYESSDR